MSHYSTAPALGAQSAARLTTRSSGLPRAKPSGSTYDVVTARILEALQQGVAPWRRPWGGAMRMPMNLTTLREYRGVNVFLLAMLGYESPFWLTYRQAQELGGHVRKGEKGAPVVFWKEWEREDSESGEPVRIPLLRHYTVFHVSQCDGLSHLVPPNSVIDNPNPPIERCETVVVKMPSPPTIRQDFTSAFYRPAQDLVGMPPLARFDSSAAYYATLFHELTHSTGHANRLNRTGITDTVRFGSEPYGREELIAEMGAAFLCAHCGIDTATLDNSAAYVAGWLQAIRQDSRLVVLAAASAQRAADYILGHSH